MTTEIAQAADHNLVEIRALGIQPKITHAAEPINDQLKNHQIAVDDWKIHILVSELHTWAERFIFEFKLQTGIPALMIDRIHKDRYGHYRPGRNGFGLRNEIAINEAYLEERKFWEILGTLLHELLHAEQEQTGKPGKNNYHDKVFKKRAESFGLIVSSSGYTQYQPVPSPFLNILKKYGVTVPDIPQPIIPQDKSSKAKLKLWICECKPKPVHVRVAIEDFHAKCLLCNQNFHRESQQ
jgi:predicted SprT family Zn-dependent metalloprotease